MDRGFTVHLDKVDEPLNAPNALPPACLRICITFLWLADVASFLALTPSGRLECGLAAAQVRDFSTSWKSHF